MEGTSTEGTSTSPAKPRAEATALILVATLAAIAAVMAGGLQDRLIWDDLALIGGLEAPTGIRDWIAPFQGSFFERGPDAQDQHYYRPIVQLSYLLGLVMWDGAPLGYAITNVLLHLTVCALLFWLLIRWGAAPPAAACATLLFGLMPRLTESVFWVSGRTDLLAAAFVLAGLLVHTRREDPPSRIGAAALLFLGLLCKEVALAGFASVLVLELTRAWPGAERGRPRKASLHRFAVGTAPVGVALAAYAGLRLVALDGAWHSTLWIDPWSRLALAAETLSQYARMLGTPWAPALRIGHVVAPRSPIAVAVGIAIAATLLFGAVLVIRRRWPSQEWLGLILAGSALALVLHIVPLGSDAVAADRFLYVPWLGLMLSAGMLSARLPIRARWGAAVLASLCAAVFAVACLQRATHWDDEVLLWHHTLVEADPVDAVPAAWLAIALLDRDEPEAGLVYAKEAMRIEMSKPPEYRKGTLILEQLANISVALSALGRDSEALHAIDQAISHRPGHRPYRRHRAKVLARMLRFDEALATLEAAGPTDASQALRRRLSSAAEAWQTLPPPRPDEPLAVRVTRARIFDTLGAVPAAEALWRSILDDLPPDDRDPRLLMAAAAFHTLRANPERAASLIEALPTGSPEQQQQAVALRRALAHRVDGAVPPAVLQHARALEVGHPS